MITRKYKISDIQSVCTDETRLKYLQILDLHQEFMEELNLSNSFSSFLKRKGVNEHLIQFLSCIEEYGVGVTPATSLICYTPPKGVVNIFA
jgi:hypothetical protein